MEQQSHSLFVENPNKFVMHPIEFDDIWRMYKIAVSSFWTPEEIDLSKDRKDWEKLSDNERYFIKHILAFFAASDGIVNENLAMRFINEVQAAEAKAFYGFQIAMENIHCVAKSTDILTDKGYLNIEFLAKKSPKVNVWNGYEFSEVEVVKTSDSSEIFDVVLSNGMSLACTSEHKWLINSIDNRIMTKDLIPGMQLLPFSYPDMSEYKYIDFELFSNPYEHGKACYMSDDTEYNILQFNMRCKYQVPMNYSLDTKIKWLKGLMENNVTHLDEMTYFNVNNEDFGRCLQHMLTTFNIICNFKRNELLLEFDSYNTCQLVKLGIDIVLDEGKKQTIFNIDHIDNVEKSKQTVQLSVVSINKRDKNEETYCFNEPLKHTGVFNGILTGQSETYSLLLETLETNTAEKHHLLNAIQTVPSIKLKAEWALKWITNQNDSFAIRLIAFACVEGIFFSGAFCSIFWLKEKGVMPGLCSSNEFISRDEALHCEFACLIFSYVTDKPSQDVVHRIIKEAVEIEDDFINSSLPCNLLGMNAKDMKQYIKYVADRLTYQLGYEKIWNVVCPFDFMDRIGLPNKTNFFEEPRVSEYAKTNVGGDNDTNQFEFKTTDDF